MCLQTFKLQHDVLLLQPCWSNELCIRGAKNRCGGQARLWLSQKRAEVLLPTHRGSFSSPDSFMPLSDTSGKRGIHPIASPCPSVVIKWRELVINDGHWRERKGLGENQRSCLMTDLKAEQEAAAALVCKGRSVASQSPYALPFPAIKIRICLCTDIHLCPDFYMLPESQCCPLHQK